MVYAVKNGWIYEYLSLLAFFRGYIRPIRRVEVSENANFFLTKARHRNYHRKSEGLTTMSAADQPSTGPTVLLDLYLLSMVATTRSGGLRGGCDGRLGPRLWRDKRLPDRTYDGQGWLRRGRNGLRAVRL